MISIVEVIQKIPITILDWTFAISRKINSYKIPKNIKLMHRRDCLIDRFVQINFAIITAKIFHCFDFVNETFDPINNITLSLFSAHSAAATKNVHHVCKHMFKTLKANASRLTNLSVIGHFRHRGFKILHELLLQLLVRRSQRIQFFN